MPASTLYSLFMQAPAIISVLRGPDHTFDLVNPMYQRLFGDRELLGKPIRAALPELEGQGFFELLDNVYATGEPHVGREAPTTLDRTGRGDLERRFFNFVYQPMYGEDHQIDGVLVFGFDVTDQVLARREKDEFIAVVAHELRTPMTSILGWMRMLRLGDLDGPTHEAALDALERSTKAQAKIIEDLLDESRIASGKLRLDLRLVDLKFVVEQAVEMVRSAAEAKEIQLVMRSGSAHYDMNGDPVRLQQVISNVLSNAIKFSPEGATVELQLSREDAEAVLQVRDHGRGITPELLPHVFDRFRQSAMGERQGGLGLGLAIARHLIEVHGGTIAAASDGEGKGAVFTMRFPLRAGAGGQSFIEREHDDRASALPSLAGVHVLVVEDNIDNRDMFVAVMGRCGATVESTTSGADALLRIERKKPDVIIADIALPDMDGCAFVTRLRKNARPEVANTPTLAVTVFGLASDQERILAAGFSALRQKPIEPADLANAVARLVEA